MKMAIAFVVGFLFAVGLCLSGMTDTGKVRGFLDILGSWDPSLMFVMVGAIGVHALLYHLWLKKKNKTLLGGNLDVPQRKAIDPPLVVGAVLFGIGWGLAGFCPGPALVSLVSLKSDVWIFVAAMFAGMLLFDFSLGRRASKI